MEQKVRVHRLNGDGTAEVLHIRESACSGDCHKCSGCGAAKETMLLTADNPIGARPGDMVIIQSESAPVLAAAAVMYMMPLGLFFLGFILGAAIGWGALCGCASFVLGVVLATMYDRRMAKKKKTVYTITGYAYHA